MSKIKSAASVFLQSIMVYIIESFWNLFIQNFNLLFSGLYGILENAFFVVTVWRLGLRGVLRVVSDVADTIITSTRKSLSIGNISQARNTHTLV